MTHLPEVDTARLAPFGFVGFMSVLAVLALLNEHADAGQKGSPVTVHSQAQAQNSGAKARNPAAPSMASYHFDQRASLLYVTIGQDPSALFSAMGHDHVVRASQWQGSMELRGNAEQACAFAIEVSVADLVADEPAMRERLGFDKPLTPTQRESIDRSMRAADQLDAARHPTITARSISCTRAVGAANLLDVVVEVSLRGRTQELPLMIVIESDQGRLLAMGEFTLTHADFGFEPYSAFFGAVRNAQEITFHFNLVGQMQP
ncbi:MAG: YceI family protein [Bradymonadaceae bacterium]|nr:YceI family protein [Lujinxingiaceae bacterium]